MTVQEAYDEISAERALRPREILQDAHSFVSLLYKHGQIDADTCGRALNSICIADIEVMIELAHA